MRKNSFSYLKAPNNKFRIPKMAEVTDNKRYDLEERTFKFAKDVAIFSNKLPKTTSNFEYKKQVIRSSGSVGANYIEANESLGDKDFLMRIKICRKEAKESEYWLRLLRESNNQEFESDLDRLYNEATELRKIFSAILNKTAINDK